MKKRGRAGSLCNFFPKSRRGQVWVETVIYTLIALVMIGLILTFVRPKITEIQDKLVLQQSISMLNDINNVILSLSEGGSGNKRKLSLDMKAGSLEIDGNSDQIVFDINSHYQFSEYGKDVTYGELVVHTEPLNDLSVTNMTLNYAGKYNITYTGKDTLKTITAASTPYTLYISNNGDNGGEYPNMDFSLG